MHVAAIITALAVSFSGSAAADQGAQAAGDAWFSCLADKFATGLTKGDLRAMSDDALSKRVNATFSACEPQESAYVAYAPDPASGRRAINDGRGKFRVKVIDQWSKVRDEAREQGAR